MPTIEEQKAIQAYVEQKNIPYLVHFTHVNNLTSILQHGFYPQAQKSALASGIAHINDEVRWDNKKSYSCFSIAFPNWRMFYRVRNTFGGDWAVLLLNNRILWEKDCLFYEMNAADNRVRFNDIKDHQGISALEKMYNDSLDLPRESFLFKCDPTDDQAEVMIPGIIDPSYIESIVFDNKDIAKHYVTNPTGKSIYYCTPSTKIYTTRKASRHGF